MANALLLRPGLLLYTLLTAAALISTPGRGWWAAITFVLICVGLGHQTLKTRLTRSLGLPGAFGGLFAGLVGWWLFVIATVALSSFNALSAWSAGALCLVSAAIALPYWRQHLTNTKASAKRDSSQYALALITLAMVAPYLVRTLVPDSDWDGALYHLPMAQNFVTDGLWKAGFQPHSLYRPGVVHCHDLNQPEPQARRFALQVP